MSVSVSDAYCIREDYTVRDVPEYFVDEVSDRVWQPDVYVEAVRAAGATGARRIIDVGCGTAGKLMPLWPTFEIVGIDFGQNLETCRARYPQATWREHDLDSDEPLPVTSEELEGAVLICSDVIEHVLRPRVLLAKLHGALETADALLLSTPERERTWGTDHLGPPPNPAHVREWSQAELGALLEQSGFAHGAVGLTRSHDEDVDFATILARLFRTAELAERAGV